MWKFPRSRGSRYNSSLLIDLCTNYQSRQSMQFTWTTKVLCNVVQAPSLCRFWSTPAHTCFRQGSILQSQFLTLAMNAQTHALENLKEILLNSSFGRRSHVYLSSAFIWRRPKAARPCSYCHFQAAHLCRALLPSAAQQDTFAKEKTGPLIPAPLLLGVHGTITAGLQTFETRHTQRKGVKRLLLLQGRLMGAGAHLSGWQAA